MTIITDRKTWRVDSQRTRIERGPLVRVQHRDGHWSKMYTQDAIEAGLIAGKKQAPAPSNKLAPKPVDKTPAPETAADDFTTIPGVGRASARSLEAQGIKTFAQLRAADLDRLTISPNVRKALEAWRD